MKLINGIELSSIETFITNFMLDDSRHNKTYAELLDIFELSYKGMEVDPSNDLRILLYSEDMENGKWTKDIIIRIKNGLVDDGIHRGVAYLRCINKGVSESVLPKVFLI